MFYKLLFKYSQRGFDTQCIRNFAIVYTDHSVIIDKELDEVYKLSEMYCTMFNIKDLSCIDKHKVEYIKHIEIIIQ